MGGIEAAKVVLEDGAREVALEALALAYTAADHALQRGDLAAVRDLFDVDRIGDPLKAALARERIIATVWREKDAREAAANARLQEGVQAVVLAALRGAFSALAAATL